MSAPSLSCVIPAYNEAENLRLLVPQLAETLAALTPRFEIIAVDDGSRDDTAAAILGMAPVVSGQKSHKQGCF